MKRIRIISVRMRSWTHGGAMLLNILFLSACSPPIVPDVTYYHLPAPVPPPRLAKPLASMPLEIETFRADGVYAEQSVIYTFTADADILRAYHYQLWSDPPSRGLQQRLTKRLRDLGIAPLVTDRLPASTRALHVQGHIRHYERVGEGQRVLTRVAFDFRVEKESGEPLLERSYSADRVATDTSMSATAQAFGAAVDETFAQFQNDLVALVSGPHHG